MSRTPVTREVGPRTRARSQSVLTSLRRAGAPHVIIGAHRGRSFVSGAQSLSSEVKLVAVCDIDPAALEPWKDETEIKRYNDYQQVLNDPDINAVCIATPVPLHARQAIAALNAGKHVLSEVTAAYTLQDGWDLIAAVERTGNRNPGIAAFEMKIQTWPNNALRCAV